MGIVYYLNDPAKGECFELGKHWLGSEEAGDYDPSQPTARQPRRWARVGYRWKPLINADDVFAYVLRVFYWIHEETDEEYADRVAARLGKWLEGRDQSQLDVWDDCHDDVHCRGGDDHDDTCQMMIEHGSRHFFVTGDRYDKDGNNGDAQ